MTAQDMRRENPLLREKVLYRKIEPGLTAFVQPKRGFKKKYAVLATNFGSIDSEFAVQGEEGRVKVPDGVAHFLEHKLFEYEGGSVTDDFSRLGASSNAFTNFNNTAYLFSCTDNFREGLELLLDFVQDPYFTQETVEREKGIIGQEIRMYEDNPQWRLFFNLLNGLYREHPVKIDIAGTVESIGQITPEILHQCYRTFYHPSNMAFFAVGDFNAEEVLEQVEANIKKRDYQSLGDIRRYYPEEPQAIHQKRVAEKMVVSQPLFYLGFKDGDRGYNGERLFRKDIVTEVLLDIIFSSSSKLYNGLYEEGLIDDSFSASFSGHQDYGHVIVGGETRDPDALYGRILEGIRDFRDRGIGAEDFERQRKKLTGQFLRDFNSLEFIANNYLAYYFRDIDMFKYIEILEKLQVEDVQERLEGLLREDNNAVSVVEPA